MENFIEKMLIKSSQFEESPSEDLLHFMEGYGLVKKIVSRESSIAGKSLASLKLKEKGILVLGIERENNWIPSPKVREVLKSSDRVVV